MTMTLPAIPSTPAGTIATSADMNALAYACTFLMTKPIAEVYDSGSAQSIPTAGANVKFNTERGNTDSMWTSGNAYFAINTAGWYRLRYSLNIVNASNNTCCYCAYGVFTPGTNSPYYGTGNLDFAVSSGRAFNETPAMLSASGVCPAYLNAGDEIAVFAEASVSSAVLSTTGFPSCASLEWVSI